MLGLAPLPAVARTLLVVGDSLSAAHGMDVGSGWKGWSFPITYWAVNGDQIISHWFNRGPGKRPDGSYYETHGVSLITYGGGGKFSSQVDLFDVAHQMHLCDELEDAGLLAPRLKEEWVIPMKRRLMTMLAHNMPKALA